MDTITNPNGNFSAGRLRGSPLSPLLSSRSLFHHICHHITTIFVSITTIFVISPLYLSPSPPYLSYHHHICHHFTTIPWCWPGVQSRTIAWTVEPASSTALLESKLASEFLHTDGKLKPCCIMIREGCKKVPFWRPSLLGPLESPETTFPSKREQVNRGYKHSFTNCLDFKECLRVLDYIRTLLET